MFLKLFSKHQFVENYLDNYLIGVNKITLFANHKKRGGRVAEGARLESVYMATYRGFESLSLCKSYLKNSIFN